MIAKHLSLLETVITTHVRRRYVRLVGRGTTALYVALRAIALVYGTGSVILPDIICANVLDAVLLAGFRPALADVSTDRFALDPKSLPRHIGTDTRAIIGAHVFGCVTPMPEMGIPVIEDAVQGLGGFVDGQLVGMLGAISVIGFHPTKMIPGFGGAVLTNDPDLWRAIQAVSLDSPVEPYQIGRYSGYRPQLKALSAALIRPFDGSPANCAAISTGWGQLWEQVMSRNTKAHYVREALAQHDQLGLHLPPIQVGDAFWRYPFTAPTRMAASRIHHRLQRAGLPGSRPYPALSTIYDPQPTYRSVDLASRSVNLWIDPHTTFAHLDAMLAEIMR